MVVALIEYYIYMVEFQENNYEAMEDFLYDQPLFSFLRG